MNASGRLNTCKSRGKRVAILSKTGARVSNAYATCLLQGDSPEKSGLIPHSSATTHVDADKAEAVTDGHA
jgi:hypothetical protein